jgi:arylsulfatase A-like enzyme
MALVAALAAGCAPPPELEAPSILLVVVDCLRADHLGSYGYERPTTPRLDELAEEAIAFEWAFAQSLSTRPSLPTILTGLYPSEHGMLTLERGENGRWVGASLDPAVATVAEELQAAGYATAMIGYQRHLSPRFGLAEGFDYYRYRVGAASSITDRFLDWVGRIETPRYFAYLHYLDIHWPYCPPASTRDRFDSGESRLTFCKGWRSLGRRLRDGKVDLEEEDVARAMARYDEELLALDDNLGQLFEALRMRGLWDETLAVVTADHGEEFMEHGVIGHSSGLFEQLIRVPLIVKPPASWPGPRGTRLDPLVELRALKPTFLDAAGLAGERPAESLVPWIAGRPGEAERREFIVAETATQVAIRTAELKLVVDRDGAGVELFDLTADPAETTNLAADRPAEVARLRQHLADWRGSLRSAQADQAVLDRDTEEGLRALGYLD